MGFEFLSENNRFGPLPYRKLAKFGLNYYCSKISHRAKKTLLHTSEFGQGI